MNKLTISQLLYYNIHIGHKLDHCKIYAAWMIYGYHQNIWMINLNVTLYMFNISIKQVINIVRQYSPFWFINQERCYNSILEWIGKFCGEISIGILWKPGMISNFLNLGFRFLLEKNLKYRLTWPRGVLITSIQSNKTILSECNKISIVSLSIIDTNTNCFGIKFVIPGNDDGMDSFLFYNLFFANLILKEKFFQVFLWYQNIWKNNYKSQLALNINLNNDVLIYKLIESYYKLLQSPKGQYIIIFASDQKSNSLNFYNFRNIIWLNKLLFFGKFLISKKRVKYFLKKVYLKNVELSILLIRNLKFNKILINFIIFLINLKISFRVKRKILLKKNFNNYIHLFLYEK